MVRVILVFLSVQSRKNGVRKVYMREGRWLPSLIVNSHRLLLFHAYPYKHPYQYYVIFMIYARVFHARILIIYNRLSGEVIAAF